MSDVRITAPAPIDALILYADVVGSTALYDRHDDAVAFRSISTCLTLLSDIIEREGGRVVKTIGDEVMALFTDPARGVMAGSDMPGAIRRASDSGAFSTGALHLRVGMHFGATMDDGEDVFGVGPQVAAAVVKHARADQVLTTRDTVDCLPAMMRGTTRERGELVVAGPGGDIVIYEVVWDVKDLTQVADTSEVEEQLAYTRLELQHDGQTVVCNAQHPRVSIGRVPGNDVMVCSDLTSRQHAEIALRRGRFVLTDVSANGTMVQGEDGSTYTLRREQTVLGERGRICMGGRFENNAQAVVDFRCHS